MKKTLREIDANTARALAVVTRSEKNSPRRRPPSRGRRTANIYSAGDGHYIHLQTQFGEDRCTQFPVTDPQTNKPTNNARPLQTDRTDNNTLRR